MATFVERRKRHRALRPASIDSIDSDASLMDRAGAADVLLRHLFIPPAQEVEGIEYAAMYRFAEKHSGGDVIDVYKRTNGNVCLSLTDISGKGVTAALHAGLVKYGVRAFASEGQPPRAVLRSLNRFYLENDQYEGSDSFASVFFACFNPESCTLTYASAGHEALLLSAETGTARALPPTGPIIGVFSDSSNIYFDERIEVARGSVLVAVSDGVSEARGEDELYGTERLIAVCDRNYEKTTEDLCGAIVRSAVDFAQNRITDDMAVIAVRFL